jgi:hypothetical protein
MEFFMDLVKAKTNDDARRAGAMTLGELRTALAALPPETRVLLEDGATPGALSSYRGYYDRLAIEPSRDEHARDETVLVGGGPGFDSEFIGHYQPGADEVLIAAPCTAAEMVKALDLADGEQFEGYKGGQFAMDRHTFLHVAEYSRTGRYVCGLRDETDSAVIETAEED